MKAPLTKVVPFSPFKVAVSNVRGIGAVVKLRGLCCDTVPIALRCLPPNIRARLYRVGVYQVCRDARSRLKVRVRPPRMISDGFPPSIVAEYTATGAGLCQHLCDLIGYKRGTTQTIPVKIRFLGE